jgi:hypothetical protein
MTVPGHENGRGVELTRVLAAIDIDDTGERTAAQAAEAAHHLGVPLALVHAVAPLPTGWRWIDTLEASTPLRVKRARVRLNEIARALNVAADVDVRVGCPPEQVAAAARERPGTLLVVGLDGDAPLGRVGSTAYRIVCLSDMPVLAVPVGEAGETGDRRQEAEDRSSLVTE